jgi:glucosamine-6-phosphate deaminase
MEILVHAEAPEMGMHAAKSGARLIRQAIQKRGESAIVVATGTSQIEMLAALAAEPGVDWTRVTMFHLDEYVGLPIHHVGSFRRYLWERFVTHLPLPLKALHLLNGEGDCAAECRRVGSLIQDCQVDVAFVGIGENGHLAFNDPPADFQIADPYIVVELDRKCRNQQFHEGWFASLEAVPTHAISMSIQQIMKSKAIICTVPDQRKAMAVRDTLEGPVTPDVPASILQKHAQVSFFLDQEAAALLSEAVVA